MQNWAFLARFCFLSERGEYEYLIEYNEEQGEINLLLYYDTEDQWPAVYKTNKTCREREAVLKLEQHQVINLTTMYPYSEISGCYFAPNERAGSVPPKQQTISIPTVATRKIRKRITTTTETIATTLGVMTTENSFVDNATTEDANMQFEGIFENLEDFTYQLNVERKWLLIVKRVISLYLQESVSTTDLPIRKRWIEPTKPRKSNRKVICRHSRRFRSSRERWWFIAVSNCNGTRGIDVNYKILMVNGPTDDYWHHHFSADEFCADLI